MTVSHHVPHRSRPASPVAPARRAVRRLPAPGAWFWLVRPDTAEAAAAIGIVLLHHLSALLVTLGPKITGHG